MQLDPVSLLSSNLAQRVFSGIFLIGMSLGCLWKGPPWSTGLVVLLFIGLLVEWTFLCFLSQSVLRKRRLFDGLIFAGGLAYLGEAFLFCFEHTRPSLNALQTEESFRFLLSLFCLVWATDVGAYGVGKLLRGPRLAPRISPKKTWSGLIGGLACGSLVGILLFPEVNLRLSFKIAAFSFKITAFFLVLVAVLGDLLESALKRYFDVKDTSSLIPGHGGLLDRLDSFLAVAFFFHFLNTVGALLTAWL